MTPIVHESMSDGNFTKVLVKEHVACLLSPLGDPYVVDTTKQSRHTMPILQN